MLDYLIKGGTVVDGTGAAPREADVGIRDRRIVEIGDRRPRTPSRCSTPTAWSSRRGSSTRTPTTTPSSTGTGWATPSSQHGVTSVIAGNCGFTLAPLKPEDAHYTSA